MVNRRFSAGPARRRADLWSAVIPALALLVAACGDVAPSRIDDARGAAGSVAITTPLPTLPPKWVLEPELWDEQGCTKLGEEDVVCPAPTLPGSSLEEDPSDPYVWRNLLGFDGPYFVGVLRAGEVILLPETVWMGSTGSWQAMGLVRNETDAPTGADVTAAVWGIDGGLLAEASAHVLVDPLRPGEPGPFLLRTEIPAEQVTRVTWSVEASGSGPLDLRDLMITAPIWELAYGDRASSDTDPTKDPPFPYVAFGSVDHLGSGVVLQPVVVAAWLDDEGRVRWVDSALVGLAPNDPGLSAALPDDLGPRWIGDFYLSIDDPDVAPLFTDPTSDGVQPMFWAGSTGYADARADYNGVASG